MQKEELKENDELHQNLKRIIRNLQSSLHKSVKTYS